MNTGCKCFGFYRVSVVLGVCKGRGNSRHWACGRRRLSIEVGVDTAAGEHATRERMLLSSSLSFHFSFLLTCVLLVLCICYLHGIISVNSWAVRNDSHRPNCSDTQSSPVSTGVTLMRLSRRPQTKKNRRLSPYEGDVSDHLSPVSYFLPLTTTTLWKIYENYSDTLCMQFRPKLYRNCTR